MLGIGEARNAQRILVEKPLGSCPLGRQGDGNTTMWILGM
jgi:hypothetical protein